MVWQRVFQLIHGSLTSLSLKHVSTYIHSVFLFFPYGNTPPPPFTNLRHRLLAACRVHRAYSVFWLYNSTIGPPSKSRPHDGCVCTGRKEGVFRQNSPWLLYAVIPFCSHFRGRCRLVLFVHLYLFSWILSRVRINRHRNIVFRLVIEIVYFFRLLSLKYQEA